MDRLPRDQPELSDAHAVFLATFGALVFVQLALDVASGQLQIASPSGAAMAAVVALAGAAVAAAIWCIGGTVRATRSRRRINSVPQAARHPWWRRPWGESPRHPERNEGSG